MFDGQMKKDTRVKICISQQEQTEFVNEEKNIICRGKVSRVLSETELEVELEKTECEDVFQKTICYTLYVYMSQMVLVGSIYYRGSVQEEKKKILSVELVSPLMKIQRRMHHRVSCHSKIFFQAISPELVHQEEQIISFDVYDISSGNFEDSMVDISGGGIRFTTRSKVNVDDYVLARFEIMNEKRAVEMKVIGQVVYAGRLRNEQDSYDVRIKYIQLSEKARKDIIQFVFQLERDKISY